MDINGYELSRAWFNFSFENPEKIKPIHTAIFFFAVEHCNRLGGKEKFGFPSQMTMDAIGVKKYQTYGKALSDLSDWGFIRFIERSKNQYSANIISISATPKKGIARGKALDKAFIKHGSKHRSKQGQSTGQGMDSIDKPLTKEPINQEPINQRTNKVYDKTVHDCYEKCILFFGEHLQPKTDSQKNNWLDTIEKLNRLDGIPFELIEMVVEGVRKDSFWNKNFLSLPKLRKNNKDGLKYIVVFAEMLKPKINEQITDEENRREIAEARRILES